MTGPIQLTRRVALAAGLLLAAPAAGARKKRPRSKPKPPLAFVQATVVAVTTFLDNPNDPRFVAQLSGAAFDPATGTAVDMNLGLFVPAEAGAKAREILVGILAGQAAARLSQQGVFVPDDRISVALY